MEYLRLLIPLCFIQLLNAASVDLFYPYGIALDQNLDVGNGDDSSSEEYPLRIPIVFYSQRKSSVWVSLSLKSLSSNYLKFFAV